jgi:hypothetical protein
MHRFLKIIIKLINYSNRSAKILNILVDSLINVCRRDKLGIDSKILIFLINEAIVVFQR